MRWKDIGAKARGVKGPLEDGTPSANNMDEYKEGRAMAVGGFGVIYWEIGEI